MLIGEFMTEDLRGKDLNILLDSREIVVTSNRIKYDAKVKFYTTTSDQFSDGKSHYVALARGIGQLRVRDVFGRLPEFKSRFWKSYYNFEENEFVVEIQI